MAEFDDLIPANAPTAGAFDDLVPASNPFDDLVPKPVRVEGKTGADFPRTRLEAGSLPVAPFVLDPSAPSPEPEVTPFQGILRSLQRGFMAMREPAAVTALMGSQGRPTIRQERRAFEQAMTDPRYMSELAEAQTPDQTQKVEALYGPERKLEQIREPLEARKQIWSGVVAEMVAERESVPRSRAQQALARAQTSGDKWKVFAKYPGQVLASIALESLPPSIAGAIVGTATLGPGAGTAVGVGTASFSTELSNTFLTEAARAGYDITDPDELKKFLDNPDAYQKAFDTAMMRASIIGGIDAATAGTAGHFIEPAIRQGLGSAIKASGKEVAVQAAGGAAGELIAQTATGQPRDWFDIAMEGFAEAVGSPVEVASNIRQSVKLRRGRAAQPKETYAPPTGPVEPSDQPEYPRTPLEVQTQGADRQDQAPVDAARAVDSFSDLIPPGPTGQAVAVAEAQTEVAPSEAQKEAGNYAKGKVSIHGLPITIENPKGSQRTGKDKDGETWSVTMPATYGYIRRTEGKDGDHVDVYIGPNPESQQVFIVDQVDADSKKFDEHKVMIGYDQFFQATRDYNAAFSDGRGGERIGAVTELTMDEFKQWLKSGDTKKPAGKLVQFPKPDARIDPKTLYVTVNAPQQVGDKTVPGYVQIDQMLNRETGETRSGMAKVLAEQGVQVPDFSGLPQGQYPYDEAVKMLAAPATPAPAPLIADEPAPVTAATFEVTSPPQTGRKPVVAKGGWDIIDASEVGFVGGISRFQERNRRSEQSKQQMADIAAKLDPRYLGESTTADQGAPIIAANGEKLAGFGRLEAIRQAYDAGATASRIYREFVQREAARLGIADKLKGKVNPVLVRRVATFEGGTAEQFASESNQAQALQFTPTELALADAKLLKESRLLDLFTISEQGVINRQFLDQFYGSIKAKDGLKSTDGTTYLPAMENRVKIAILTALLSEAKNPEVLIRRIVEKGAELGLTRQVNGVAAIAAKLLGIATVNPTYNLGPHLAVAFEEYLDARSQKEAGWITELPDYMAQKNLFSNGRTPESGLILEVLWNSKSAKAVAEFFDGYARRASAIARDVATPDMFGNLPAATVMEILERSRTGESQAQQTELLGRREPDESRPGEREAVGAGGVPAVEQSAAETLPFEQLSTGHKKFHGALQKLVANRTIDQERLVLLEEIFRNTNPAFLEGINVEDIPDLKRAGIAYVRQRRMAIRRGLALKLANVDGVSEAEREFWTDRSNEPVVVFLHEYGHLAHGLVLNDEDIALANTVFKSLGKTGRRTVFSAMTKGEQGVTYYAGNLKEFLAQAFAEYVISRKVPENRLLPILRKMYDAFISGVRRLLGLPQSVRNDLDRLTPVFEKMLAGGDVSLAEINALEVPKTEVGLGTVATDPETARRALIRAESRGEVDVERLGLNIQVSDLLNALEKTGVDERSAEGQLLGFGALRSILTQTEQPRTTYKQFKDQYPDAPKALSIDAGLKLVLELDRWAKVRERLAEQWEKVNRKGFQKKMVRLNDKELQREALKIAWENFQARIKDAVAKARTALKREGRNEGRAEMLLRQISSLESVETYQAAIEQAVTDMVNLLAKSPDVTTLVSQNVPDVAALVREYGRIKAGLVAAGQSSPAQEDIIIEWAGQLLGQSWDQAQQMILAALAGGNIRLQAQMSRFEKAVFRGLRDKPKSAIGEILRTARTNAKATALTALAWQKLRREVSKEIDTLVALQRADEAVRQIQQDGDFKSYRAQVTNDAGIELRPDAEVKVGDQRVRISDLNYDAVSGRPIFPLPNGNVVQVDLTGDKPKFESERVKMQEALDVYRDWKSTQDSKAPEERDPFYQYFVNWMTTLEQVYLSSRVTQPSSLETMGNLFSNEKPGAWDMPRFLLDDLATRIGGASKPAASNFSRVLQLARNLMTRQHELANAQYRAARSYKFKGGRNEQVVRMYDEVLQPLFAMAQRPGFVLKVGMEVGQGFTVTKEAADLLRLERDLAKASFKIVQQDVPAERPGTAFVPIIKDHVHGIQWFGKSMEVNETTLPFGGYTEGGLATAQQYAATKLQGGDPSPLIESNYDLWFSFMDDRATVVADGESPYESAYRLVIERAKAVPPSLGERNLTWLAGQVASITGEPIDEVRTQMLTEMDKVLMRLNNLKGEIDPTVTVQTADKKTSFTARRHDQNFPYYFMRYGFRTGADFINFIGNVHSGALERFISALGEVKLDLERQRQQLTLRYEQKMREGMSRREAIKATLRERQNEVLNGETTEQFRSLNKRIKTTDRVIKMLNNIYGGGGSDAELDIRTWRRLSTGFVGSLLSAPTVLVRNATGLVYLGMLMSRLRQNALRTSVSVGARLVWDGLVRTGVVTPLFRAVKFIVGHGPFRNAMEAAYDRIDRYSELEEAGLVTPLHWLDEMKAKLQNLTTGGIVLDTERGPAENTALSAMGLFDALILTGIAKPVFPRLGDKIINVATSAATDDMVLELENKLKRMFMDWSEAGALDTRLADPDFRLTTEEMFPAWIFKATARQKMEFLRQAFEWSGVTIDQAAKAYLQKLQAGQTDASLLEDWQRINLKDFTLQTVNVPGPLNRPLWTHERNFFAQLFAPLTGWNIATLRQMVKYVSRAGVGKRSDWILIGLTVIPLLLTLGFFQDIGTEELIRMLYQAMGKERATRQPWEQTGADRQAVGVMVSALNPIPYVSMVVNSAVNDMPGRASFDPTPVVINKLKDVFSYVGGVTRTGDPTFGLDRLVKGFIPLADPFISNAPQASGVQEAMNFRRLLTRHGDPDLLKPQDSSTAGLSTPLTPYGRSLLNAAIRGDEQGFLTLYREAVEKARQMGKADPEKAVKTLFASQNPYDRAFKRKLTGLERDTVLSKMTPEQRKAAERVEDRYARAASLIGAPANFERVEKKTPSVVSVGGRRSRRGRTRFGRGIRARRGRRLSARLGRRRQPRLRLARGRRR